jgi:hypothetical protein
MGAENPVNELRWVFIDKTHWPPGVWKDEPDKVEWDDDMTGYPCVVHRTEHLGNLCGYVAVPAGHPCFGNKYDDVEVTVHGGLTYAGPNEVIPNRKTEEGLFTDHPGDWWWFGFDCAHWGDYLPMKLISVSPPGGDEGVYCDVPYVMKECQMLAFQLRALAINCNPADVKKLFDNSGD